MSVTATRVATGGLAGKRMVALGARLARPPVPELACLAWAAAMLGAKLTGSWTPISFAPDPLTGFALLAGGAWARTQRADSRVGGLMLLASAAWFAEDLRTLEQPLPATFGAFFANASLPAIAWLTLAFPDGRLPGRTERNVLIACAVVAGPLAFAGIEITNAPPLPGAPRPWPGYVTSSQVDNAVDAVIFAMAALCAVAVAVLVARRLLHAARPTRRYALPFASVTVVLAAVIGVHQVALAVTHDHFHGRGAILATEQALLVALALAFPLGLLRLRLARGGLARMLTQLRGSAGHLRDVLAGALDDPELELVLWDDAGARWTDEGGGIASPPVAGPGRAVLELRRGRDLAGAVVTDQTWALDEELVSAVGIATALELGNARLVAGRRTLVAAADAELRRLERNLHDGAQQRLVALTMHLAEIEDDLRNGRIEGTPERIAAARADLHQAIREVRALGAGAAPPELEDFGLGAAVESLAKRSAIPLDLDVDLRVRPSRSTELTAWFVICEALANAGKHAAATRIAVTVSDGGGELAVEVVDDGKGGADRSGRGLRALAQRVASEGGRITVEDAPAGGTIVRARFPAAVDG